MELTTEDKSAKSQEARTELREQFLRFMSSFDKKCTFHTIENTTVRGKFVASDAKFEQIFVQDLETPFQVYDSAILRVNDIAFFETV